MEFNISKNDLTRLLARASSSAAADRSPIPMLKNVVLDVSATAVTARGTDQYIGSETRTDAKVKTPGRIAVAGRLAAELAKSLPVGDVRVKLGKTHLEISHGKSKSKLPALSADEFPAFPASTGNGAQAKASDIARALDCGGHASAKDDTRPHIYGVLIEPGRGGKGVRVVSTDGQRMAWSEVESTGTVERMFVPQLAVVHLLKFCEAAKDADLGLTLSNGVLFVTAGGDSMHIKTGDVAFPPWDKLVPSKSKHTIRFAKDLALDALRRVRIFAKDDMGHVKVTLVDGEMRFSVAVESGTSDETVDCDATCEMDFLVVGDLFSEAVSHFVDDDVTMKLNGDLDPILLTGSGDYSAVIMPLRK
jgi:DNA polymerase-3 subunit beta